MKQEFRQSELFSTKFTHSVVIEQYGQNVDITDLVKEIKEITYQINNYANVELILLDREKRIFNMIHFNGPHTIKIVVDDISTFSIRFNGVVRKFTPIDIQNDLYSVSLWSFYESQNTKPIRKGFVGQKTPTQIILELMKDKQFFQEDPNKAVQHYIEQCESDDMIENFIVPNWNFYTTLQYLKQFARSRSNSMYYFFESSQGLNFVSKQLLLSNGKLKGPYVFKFSSNQSNDLKDLDYKSIEDRADNIVPLNVVYDYNLCTGIDTNNHIKNFDFGFRSYQLDYTNKQITTNIRDFKSMFEKSLTINSKSLLDSTLFDRVQNFNIIEYVEFSNLYEAYSNYHMQKNMMSDLKMKLITNGMLFLNIGDLVKLNVPGIANDIDVLTGLWMIEKVSHRVEVASGSDKQQRLTTTITVSRDSINIDETTATSLNLLKKKQLTVV